MNDGLKQGLVQVYTGNSKGKTTAALGLGLRAVGHGFHVKMIQFLKGTSYSGELYSVERLYPLFTIESYGRGCPYGAMIKNGSMSCTGCMKCFVMPNNIDETDRLSMDLAMDRVHELIQSGQVDVLILDEISNAMNIGLVSIPAVLTIIDHKPENMEIVLTGRNMPEAIIGRADLVTEMIEIKHPHQRGIPGRRGIEY
jgi:cob(I)alamin adenosyltransferase